MPGHRNPLGMAGLIDQIHGAVSKAKSNAHNVSDITKTLAKENNFDIPHVDLVFQVAPSLAQDLTDDWSNLLVQFIGANDLPKMDVVGSADPYFIAKLDDKISFVYVDRFRMMILTQRIYRSTVKSNTLSPVWNETWRIKNVPSTATLHVQVMDKDNDTPTDDYIGRFQTTISAGTKEVEIESPLLRRSRGNFWFKVSSCS